MARDFQINGETLVMVKGAQGTSIEKRTELGLAAGGVGNGVKVDPKFFHTDLHVDDFGPNVPAEVLWQLAECRIDMTLVHYDRDVLDICLAESMGGRGAAGVMTAAGLPMGNLKPLFDKDCHYISLTLRSPQLGYPWRFRATYLAENPMSLPLGTEKSMVLLRWRAIPYVYPAPIPPFSASEQARIFLRKEEIKIAQEIDDEAALALAQAEFKKAKILETLDGFEIKSANAILWDHGIDTATPGPEA